jgi:pimeloyl-ACP methyl ester carboxylesterase
VESAEKHVAESDTAARPSGTLESECCGGIGDPRMDCDSPLSAHLRGGVPVEGKEGCPTPLAWQQVLAGVAEQSRPWSVAFSRGQVSGIEFGQGPPLYFLNAAGGDHRLWMHLCWLFREDRTCILFDEPAWSSAPRPGQWRSCMTDAVRAIADQRGDDRFSIYASGLGGLVALELMRASPDRVDVAVLQGAFLRRKWSPVERLLSLIGRVTPGRIAKLPGWEKIQEQNHRLCFPPYDPTRWEFLRDNLASTPIKTASYRMAVAARGVESNGLSSIKAPIMLIRCEADGASLSKLEDQLAAALPHARMEWMHTSGHFPHVTHPHRLAKIVRPFLVQDASQRP